MKDEIKEIIDRLERIDHKEYIAFEFADNATFDEMARCFEERKKMANYITNLQEENERLDMIVTIQEDYKSRNEKAIEYIKQSIDNPQPFYEYLFGDENGKVENLDKLLNILQGSDKDE